MCNERKQPRKTLSPQSLFFNFSFFVPTPTAMTFATARQKVRRSQGKKLKEKEGKNVFPHVPSVVLGQLIPLFDPV